MFSRLFNRHRKEKDEVYLPDRANLNFAFLGADMHSHFIPGIDDGAKTVEESVNMIKSLVDLGYKTIITTPHIMIDYYKNTPLTINEGLEKVRSALQKEQIDVRLEAAAEYYIDEYFIQLLETEPLLTVHNKEVLVECSMMYEPPNLTKVIFDMIASGYRPILAHPERYVFFHNKFDSYRELRDRGCLLQLNMLSLTGYYGKNIKTAAESILANGMYDYIGTDAHHERHIIGVRNIINTKIYDMLIGYPLLNSKLCL